MGITYFLKVWGCFMCATWDPSRDWKPSHYSHKQLHHDSDSVQKMCVYIISTYICIYRYTYKNMCKAFSTLVENCQREYVFKNSKRHWTSMNFISNNWTCWFRQQTPTKQRWWMLFAIFFGHQATICEKVWSTKVPKYRMTDPKVCHND